MVRVGWLPILAHAGLLVTWDLVADLGTTFFWLALAFVGMILGVRRLSGLQGSHGALILAVAVLLRLLVLPLPSTLSDDIQRYLWDGKVAASGLNPYVHEPNATEVRELRDEAWEQLPHRQVPTVYPPFAVAAFSVATQAPAPALALELLLTLFDLVTCVLLMVLARAVGIPGYRVAWYAWNPMVSLEVAGMGHVDALGVTCMVLLAICLSHRPQWVTGAALAATGGVLAKLVPLVGFPAWARLSGRPLVFLSIAIGASAVALVPVFVSSGGVPPGLVAFGIRWEFNGPIFEPLWRLVDGLGVPTAASRLLDSLKAWTGQLDFWNQLYPFNYPQLWAKIVLGVVLLAALGVSVVRRFPLAGMLWIFGSVVVCSATVYPWYLLWVLPWAALTENRAWLLASATVMLSYIPQFTEVELFPWIYLAVWAPPLMVWMQNRWSSD
jgi:alpha-1,6-mannosyltransferase